MGKRPNGDGSIYFNAAKKRWIAEIIVGYTKAGRRILRSMSAVSQAEAVKNLDTLKRRYAFGPAADAGKMTLSRWLEIYMQSRENEIKTRTLISYQHDADYIRRTPAANVKIENLTPTIIAAALNIYRGHPRIAAGCLTLIKAACRRALADGVITRNPAFGVKMPKNAYRGKIVTLTPEQVAALCAAADRQTQILIKIGYATGARPEEICGLRWEDINFAAAEITIARAAVYLEPDESRGRAGQVVLTDPKTPASRRCLPVPRLLIRDLKAWRREQAETMISAPKHPQTAGMIGYNKRFGLLNVSALCSAVKKAARAAGLDGVTTKSLRHTHATQLFAAGWAAVDVQKRLGHTTIKTTIDVYTHYIPSRAREIADYIESIYPK